MRSLALLCDGTCARRTIDDLFYATQRTLCPTVRKFSPKSTNIRHEPPVNADVNKNIIGLIV